MFPVPMALMAILLGLGILFFTVIAPVFNVALDDAMRSFQKTAAPLAATGCGGRPQRVLQEQTVQRFDKGSY